MINEEQIRKLLDESKRTVYALHPEKQVLIVGICESWLKQREALKYLRPRIKYDSASSNKIEEALGE